MKQKKISAWHSVWPIEEAKMNNEQNKSEMKGIAKRYKKVLERLRKPLGRYVKDEIRKPWSGAVWITEADLAKAKLSGRADEVKPRFVPLAEIARGEFGDPTPAVIFSELIKAYGPSSAFILVITGSRKKASEILLVEQLGGRDRGRQVSPLKGTIKGVSPKHDHIEASARPRKKQ